MNTDKDKTKYSLFVRILPDIVMLAIFIMTLIHRLFVGGTTVNYHRLIMFGLGLPIAWFFHQLFDFIDILAVRHVTNKYEAK